MKKLITRTLFLVLVVMLLVFEAPLAGVQASPADGIYDVAVLRTGSYNLWKNTDFSQLSVAPGIESYTWTTVPVSSLTAVGLAPYDVLIVPCEHLYTWLDADRASAVVTWVNSGKLLIVHNYKYSTALNNDPLMAAFGPNYYVDWTGENGGYSGDSVVIVDPTSPLVTTPNVLSAADLSNWSKSVHNSVDPDTAGSAWSWVADSATRGWHWLGYAPSGGGTIIILGGDPEAHNIRKLIENEIVFVGVSANQPPDTSAASADPGCLWPPNHKYVEINIMGVTDPDCDPITITIAAITSDEPTSSDKGSGGAKHAPDASGIGTDTASVRAERSGDGDGRVYVIEFTASDGNGGESKGTVTVGVPHDQSSKKSPDCPAIDSGQNYDATGIN